jgi:hypothetical protein
LLFLTSIKQQETSNQDKLFYNRKPLAGQRPEFLMAGDSLRPNSTLLPFTF